MKRVIAVFRLVRLPNTFGAWADICLGFFISAAAGRSSVIFLPLVVSTLIYWAGFVLNDVFDIEEDRRDFPSRPLPAGEISRRAAIVIAAGFLLVAVAIAAMRSQMLLVAAALIGAVFLYDGWLKRTVAGPFVMGLCRFLNVLLGASAVGALSFEHFSRIFPPAAAVMFFVTGLTFWSRSERRQARRGDGIAALVCLNVSFTIAAYWCAAAGCWPIMTAFGALFVAGFDYLAIRTLLAGRPEAYNRAMRLGLVSIIVYDGLLLAAVMGPAGLLLWALVLPNLVLRRFFATT